jgi:cyclophilin family peptidyl-prolyl cis-trans isomerase
MKKAALLILISVIVAGVSAQKSSSGKKKQNTTEVKDLNQKVRISTDFGDIVILLYDKTPLHRDNFIKLVNDSFYNGILFHRVIQDFMIQGGDPDSKNAQPEAMLGDGGPGYTVKAEFNPALFHKRGTLCAARMADNVNPAKESSGSQFYIVQGKKFSPSELTNIEHRVNQSKKAEIINGIIANPPKELKEKVDSARAVGTNESYTALIKEIEPFVDKELAKKGVFTFSEEQKKIYTTVGGTPHLDGSYTVFGEVMEGMEVVEKIAAVQKDRNDRPLTDIKMTITLIK